MNDYRDVIKSLRDSKINTLLAKDLWYVVPRHSAYRIRISRPDPFSDYQDIIARVTLFYNDKVIMDNLISSTSDLEKFWEKVYNKIYIKKENK